MRTKEAAEQRNAAFKAKGAKPAPQGKFSESSLDIDDIEQQMLNKYKKNGVNN